MLLGGGTKSELWLKIIATVLGVPVDLPAAGEVGGAFGAARMGLMAATGDSVKSVCGKPKTAKEALLARASQRTGKPAPGKKKKRGGAARDRAPVVAEPESEETVESSEDEAERDSSPPDPPPRRGLWERVKRLFRPG